MKTVTTTLTTEAIFSEDNTKRYLLRKTWDAKKPNLAIIMLAPSAASGVALDSTTLLVLNNAYRLGYGSVAILNLFSVLNDFALKQATDDDKENSSAIISAAKTANVIVYAPGVGKVRNKSFQQRQKLILTALLPYETKLKCLCDEAGKSRLQHPLSPAVHTWFVSPLKVSELVPQESPKEVCSKPKGKSVSTPAKNATAQ